MTPQTLLIADDHPLFRAALSLAIREIWPGTQILEAANFTTLEAVAAANPGLHLFLLDLNMPGAMGLSALVYLRGEYPAIPVVVISANDQSRMVRRTQQFGAAAFISKSLPVAQMQDMIQAVMKGDECFIQPTESNEADTGLATLLAQLTPQQLRVLMCIGDGLPNKEIAYRLGVAENTVKIHVTAILRKLQCQTRMQLVLLVKNLEAPTPE